MRCPAGSVVVRCTAVARSARATAIAAAMVVLPTPPLPMHMISPWSCARGSSTRSASGASATSRSNSSSAAWWTRIWSEQRPHCVQSDHIGGLELDLIHWQRPYFVGKRRDRPLLALADRRSERIIIRGRGRQDPIDHDVLVGQADAASSRCVRPSRSVSTSGRGPRAPVGCAAGRQRLRPRRRRAARCLSSPASGPRQEASPLPSVRNRSRSPAVGAAGWCGRSGRCRTARGRTRRSGRRNRRGVGELVEGGDLGRARPGELLGDRLHSGVGQQPADGADDAFAVRLGRLLRVDVQGATDVDCGDCGDGVADGQPEDLAEVRRRVGADQQDPLALARPAESR